MNKETNIFELLNDTYHLPNKVKLFETFSGIGCQRLGFKRAGIEVDMVGISEIDKYAIRSYEAIHGHTKNFGSICDIKGQDLPMIDVLTYSFPCQSLSKAGTQGGLDKGHKSNLVYEVLRILEDLKIENRLPQVLIMENVIDLVQKKFIKQFNEIQNVIECLGYKNYTEVLNSKNYGVAQTRPRVFMVSILGNYYYDFPKPIPLEKKLKDYLEENVSEKFFLSEKMIKCFTDMTNRNGLVRGDRFNPHDPEKSEYAFAITTLAGNRATDNFVLIPEKTKDGYSVAHEGDGVYLNRPHQKRGVVQQGMIQTLLANGNDLGVVVKDEKLEKLRIRKLTPRECWRLMGISDEDFEKAEKVNSNAQLYRQAGNGIVVDLFAQILEKMK